MTTLQTYSFTNPGFETGNMTGWSVDNANISVVTFGFDDGPRTGSYLAKGGLGGGTPGVTSTSFWQIFDLTPWADYIDTGLCTVSAWTIYHATRDDQVDDGKTGGSFYDVSSVLLDTWFRLAPAGSPRPGWEAITLGARAVPVGARSVRMVATSIWYEGGQNDNYWDDAQPFNLDYSGPPLVTPVTHDAALALSSSFTLSLISGALHFREIAFRGLFSLGLAAHKFPLFDCPAPTPKTWARATVAAKEWACVTVVPAEECDGIEVGVNDNLDVVSGDRLVTIDGYGFGLVS